MVITNLRLRSKHSTTCLIAQIVIFFTYFKQDNNQNP